MEHLYDTVFETLEAARPEEQVFTDLLAHEPVAIALAETAADINKYAESEAFALCALEPLSLQRLAVSLESYLLAYGEVVEASKAKAAAASPPGHFVPATPPPSSTSWRCCCS